MPENRSCSLQTLRHWSACFSKYPGLMARCCGEPKPSQSSVTVSVCGDRLARSFRFAVDMCAWLWNARRVA